MLGQNICRCYIVQIAELAIWQCNWPKQWPTEDVIGGGGGVEINLARLNIVLKI
jgi:hypothetical protein